MTLLGEHRILPIDAALPGLPAMDMNVGDYFETAAALRPERPEGGGVQAHET